ncbi:MAG TPA: DUF4388 domain-containing protein [Acidimicrobiales bacterium]|nr:DUF4388 domain-containing protein [Acidimicrobiales bacterium]
MALQGNLGAFALPDVLRLLATTRKTGCLYVEGDRGRGSVWLDEGGVVAATAGRALNAVPVDEAVFELLRHRRGSFRFSLDEAPPLETVQALDLESTLLRALQLLDEWRELEAVVPSLSHRVELVPELAVGHVTIDSARWATLAAVADGVSVGKLAESLGMGEIDVSRAVRDLVDMGVVRVGPPAGSQPQPQPAPSRLDSGRTPVTAGVGVGAGASRGNGADHHSPISAQVVTRPRTGPIPAIDDLDV